jgi:hypothetical protein
MRKEIHLNFDLSEKRDIREDEDRYCHDREDPE